MNDTIQFYLTYQFTLSFVNYIYDYWKKQRENDSDYTENEILNRKIVDLIIISSSKVVFNNLIEKHNNITIEKKDNGKDGISERAKRARRRKIRVQMDKEVPDFASTLSLNENTEQQVQALEPASTFKEQLSVNIPVIDRIVISSHKRNFNLNKISELPKEGSFSVMTNGEYMFINIDYEIINKSVAAIESIRPVLLYLADNNYFNNEITQMFIDAKMKSKINTLIKRLFDIRYLKLWGFEVAFDIFNKTAADLINTSDFRIYDKKITGLPTFYSKDSLKNSLIILYDRKEKLKIQGVNVPYDSITRLEIKFYGTYMKSKTFKPDLTNWLNNAPILLALNNRKQLAMATKHSVGGKNVFKKLQEYIKNRLDFLFLNWILDYAFPSI